MCEPVWKTSLPKIELERLLGVLYSVFGKKHAFIANAVGTTPLRARNYFYSSLRKDHRQISSPRPCQKRRLRYKAKHISPVHRELGRTGVVPSNRSCTSDWPVFPDSKAQNGSSGDDAHLYEVPIVLGLVERNGRIELGTNSDIARPRCHLSCFPIGDFPVKQEAPILKEEPPANEEPMVIDYNASLFLSNTDPFVFSEAEENEAEEDDCNFCSPKIGSTSYQ